MVKGTKVTSIQLHDKTRRKLEGRKIHVKESYESVIKRLLDEETPSIREMFKLADSMPQERQYSTEEVVKLSHRLRKKR